VAEACAAAMAAGSAQDMEDLRRPALRPLVLPSPAPSHGGGGGRGLRGGHGDRIRAGHGGSTTAPSALSSSLLPSIRVLAAHGVDAGTRAAIRRRAVEVAQVTNNALALVNATTGVLPFLPLAYNRGKAWSLLPSSCSMKCIDHIISVSQVLLGEQIGSSCMLASLIPICLLN